MNFTKKSLVIAIATTLPWMAAHAQSPADLQKQIEMLQQQLKVLQSKVQELSNKNSVDPAEFNRLAQQVELKEEVTKTSGFSDLTVKGVLEANYLSDGNGTQGFAASNGYDGYGMLEITKQAEGGKGVNWTLRLKPGATELVHEASVSVPLTDDGLTRVIGGLIPDWSGYEYSFSNQNPLVTHNMLFNYTAATSYKGAGLQYTKGPLILKGMLANIDTSPNADRGVPGIAYSANWTINEFSYLNFSGAHSRVYDLSGLNAVPAAAAIRPFDLMEIDGGYLHGDWALNAQLSFGKVKDGASNGADASWWGVSGFAGYKLTPRLQAIVRYDYISNQNNGGGLYFDPSGGKMFGPELDSSGAVIDPTVGTNRSALSLGINYAINPSTLFKTEVRFDQSSGYNFVGTDGLPTKSNTTVGAAVVVSF
jgi:hypothetical protein